MAARETLTYEQVVRKARRKAADRSSLFFISAGDHAPSIALITRRPHLQQRSDA